MNYVTNLTNVVVTAMLGVIMVSRLHAMYERSGRMLLFLVIICLAVNIACGAIAAIALKHVAVEELILSGAYICYYRFEKDAQLLTSMVWMLNTFWEVLALCLSVRIAVKHFRELRRLGPSTAGLTVRDCLGVLIKSHVLYFASFAGVSCTQLVLVSPELLSQSMGAQILNCAFQIFLSVQIFVLGPRLILSVREYRAKLVVESNAEISMTSVVFLEHVHVQTSSTV
ncbi:hypothetical protein BDR03DRAFT_694546 [Suillus americanus]|nr:hypothetical protein BDR03DRAFT_694546 [Suillus americanus]